MNMYQHNHINSIVESNIKSSLETFSNEEIEELIYYLDHQLYFQLAQFLKQKDNAMWEGILDQLLKYQIICSTQNIDFLEAMNIIKMQSMKAGTQKSSKKNIIMQGINVTLRSIIDRQFDKDRIDNNLRLGAKERKEHIRLGHHKISHNKTLFDEHTPIHLSKKQHTTTEITRDATGKKKITHYQHPHIIKLSPNTTVNDYQEGVKVLNEMDFNNPLDTPLSHPLDIPPVGKSGATLITSEGESIIKHHLNQETIDEPKNIPEIQMPSNETQIKSIKVQTVNMPPEKIYNEVPFIK